MKFILLALFYVTADNYFSLLLSFIIISLAKEFMFSVALVCLAAFLFACKQTAMKICGGVRIGMIDMTDMIKGTSH